MAMDMRYGAYWLVAIVFDGYGHESGAIPYGGVKWHLIQPGPRGIKPDNPNYANNAETTMEGAFPVDISVFVFIIRISNTHLMRLWLCVMSLVPHHIIGFAIWRVFNE